MLTKQGDPQRGGSSRTLGKKWIVRFDRSATTTSNGLGIVLTYEDGDIMPLSFKLKFPYSNNAAKYKAYLTGLAIVLSIGVKRRKTLTS